VTQSDTALSGLLNEVKEAQRLPPPAIARAIRESAGITQQQLADAVHVHRVTLARWESDRSAKPKGELRARYAVALRGLRELVES
jgi:DNA-binding transcriptional regulator YiaG